MSKERYDVVGSCTIKDTLTNDYIEIDECCELLNQQQQRIAELEEQLKNAIVVPISTGQKIYYVYETDIDGDIVYIIDKGYVESISIDVDNIWFRGIYDSGLTFWHLLKDFNNKVFATKEEAQAKLEELRGNDVKDN